MDVFPPVGDFCKVALEPKEGETSDFHNAERTNGSRLPLTPAWRGLTEFVVATKSSTTLCVFKSLEEKKNEITEYGSIHETWD